MFRSKATITTNRAHNYLRKLCIHWQNRFDVEFNAKTGVIDFGDDQMVHLTATEISLDIYISAAQKEVTEELEIIVAEHINRFTRTEHLHVDWYAID